MIAQTLLPFLRKNHPVVRGWDATDTVSWLMWAERDGRCVTVDENGQTAALCVFHLSHSSNPVTGYYGHTENGDTVFLDLVVGSRKFFPSLTKIVTARTGTRQWVSYGRPDRSVRRFAFKDFERKMNHGKQLRTPTTTHT